MTIIPGWEPSVTPLFVPPTIEPDDDDFEDEEWEM